MSGMRARQLPSEPQKLTIAKFTKKTFVAEEFAEATSLREPRMDEPASHPCGSEENPRAGPSSDDVDVGLTLVGSKRGCRQDGLDTGGKREACLGRLRDDDPNKENLQARYVAAGNMVRPSISATLESLREHDRSSPGGTRAVPSPSCEYCDGYGINLEH